MVRVSAQVGTFVERAYEVDITIHVQRVLCTIFEEKKTTIFINIFVSKIVEYIT